MKSNSGNKKDGKKFSENKKPRTSFSKSKNVRKKNDEKTIGKPNNDKLISKYTPKKFEKRTESKRIVIDKKTSPIKTPDKKSVETIRLNKYLSNSGICSRRDADMYIKAGNVSVNGKIIVEMGYQVKPNDIVKFDNETINPETKRYVLLNKPKDYITTLDDERDRKTVMELVRNTCNERIYPVGRLDRNTTGLLLFTNDGDLAKKLTHPKHNIKKIYQVTLDQKVTALHLKKIADPSFKVEDLEVKVDSISYIEGSPKNEIGIEIHSGRNRIVRKIFESLNYKVVKLDRVVFAGLTKKDLPRGKWRHLSQQEVINLRILK